MIGEEAVADDFRLLFKAIVFEAPAFDQVVAIAAKGMTHQWQVKAPALLGLPYMGQLVDEDALAMQGLSSKIFRPKIGMGVEVDAAGWCHRDVARLEGPPPSADHADLRVIDRVAEDASGQFDFS